MNENMLRQTGSKLTALICASLALPTAASAEAKIDADNIFDDWSVFIDSGDCWLASYPKDNQHNDIEDITMFVAFHQRSMKPEISVLFEGGMVDISDVKVVLGGKAYSLGFYEDTAFTAASENMEILKKMLAAEPTSLSFFTSTEAVTDLTIGYEGFRDAYNFTSKNCDFFKNNNLDGDRTKEPV